MRANEVPTGQRRNTPAQDLELYIHIPFCKTKCKFCFYVSFVEVCEAEIDAYLTALEQEIEFRWHGWKPRESIVNSLYIGGGTPSLLSLRQWSHLIRVLTRFWETREIPEVTVECNPSSIDEAKLRIWRAAGFNRISLGVQNLDGQLLQRFGREGTPGRFSHMVDLIRKNGFENINCDVLVGLPGETQRSVDATLDVLVQNKIPHISVYPFVLRNNTGVFADESLRRECLAYKTERMERFRSSTDYLLSHGYLRIGTAHFALDDKYVCIHHHKYWDGGNVLGFGVSAQSFIDGRYMKNISDLEQYIGRTPDNTQALSISLDSGDLIRRWALLGLSKRMMFRYSDLEARFGSGSAKYLQKELSELSKAGLVELNKDQVHLSWKGMEQIHLLSAVYFKFKNEEYLRRVMRIPEELQPFCPKKDVVDD